MRFLVDENLPGDVASVLQDLGHDVLDVAASPHRGAPDSEIWRRAIDERRILVTRDLGFPVPRASTRPPGVIVVRPPLGARLGAIVRLFKEAMASINPASLVDHVTVIEPGRVRQRPYRHLPRSP